MGIDNGKEQAQILNIIKIRSEMNMVKNIIKLYHLSIHSYLKTHKHFLHIFTLTQ